MARNLHGGILDDSLLDDEELDELSAQGYDEETNPPLMIWPKNIGIALIVFGFITVILGTLELFFLPLVVEPEKQRLIHLGKDNCFGAGLFSGIFMILTGSFAVRASISKRPTSVRKFFNQILVTLLLYTATTILVIYGYCKKWTTQDQYLDNSFQYEIHIFVSVSTCLGFLFVIATAIHYHEIIFCGEYQLCWLSCFKPCCQCKKKVILDPILLPNQPI